MKENLEEVMLDLLCKKAVYGLEAAEEKQLADVEQKLGMVGQSQSFELTAAAISIADLDTSSPMPASLRSRILADAESHFAERAQPESVPVPKVVHESRNSIFTWFPWAVAAAACIALALNIYFTRPQNPIVQGGVPTPSPEERLTPAQMRQRLIDAAPDLARGTWGPGNMKDVAPAGDIVWSDEKQAGYMRLQGLPVNDKGTETYQLWIFDETQSDKTPIDGGTFNVNAEGEVIIPINAKLSPKNTKMYAITVEKPGGVVVSERKKLVALAKRET